MTDLTPDERAFWRTAASGVSYGVNVKSSVILALLDDADERDRLAAAVERVRALHERDGEGFCVVCDYMTPHPCPTLRALDGTDD